MQNFCLNLPFYDGRNVMLFGNGAKIEKGKGKYSLFSNLHYHYKNLLAWEPKLFWMGLLLLIPWTLVSILGNILPAAMVAGLEQKWKLEYYMGVLLALILGKWVCGLAQGMMSSYCSNSRAIYRAHYSKPYVQKKMRVDYEVLENKEFQTNASAAYTAIFQGRGIDDATWRLPNFIAFIGQAIIYGILLTRVSFWILLLALICAYVQIKLLKLARTKHGEAHPFLADDSKKMSYITSQSMEPSAGKDIRIYRMAEWLMKKYVDTLDDMNGLYYKVHNWYFVRGLSDAGLDFLRNGLIYGYLIYLVTAGKLSIAEFVLYFGFANSFANQMFLALREALSFGIISNTFSSIREYFDTKEHRNEGNRIEDDVLEKIKQDAVTLELKDVSYTYPGQDTPTISNMNLTVTAGEKLALIGLNGAGKTTLVKLICGFYTPTVGEILINGISIEKFERRQYYSLLSVLFQDYSILPFTLDENIASVSKDGINEVKLHKSLDVSGFKERYQRLPEKGDSLLIKEINDKAVDFSGGEKQRLLFARALYKETPLLILDEPTAALDPIAENEIYLKYGEATQGRTSIYISHRLSSTRFCDRIVLLENGCIVEMGTHAELMKMGGKYANLYELQSQYYKEQEKEIVRIQLMEGEV
jgi:ABC-type multidrug transport system fused ATPase/permease subunit